MSTDLLYVPPYYIIRTTKMEEILLVMNICLSTDKLSIGICMIEVKTCSLSVSKKKNRQISFRSSNTTI